MLVLTRKKEQALMIGDNIEVRILDIQGDQIRLGVEAPKNVKVYRKEIYLEIQEENMNAAKHAARIPAAEMKDMLQSPGRLNRDGKNG